MNRNESPRPRGARPAARRVLGVLAAMTLCAAALGGLPAAAAADDILSTRGATPTPAATATPSATPTATATPTSTPSVTAPPTVSPEQSSAISTTPTKKPDPKATTGPNGLGASPYRGWSSWGQQTVNDIMSESTIRAQSDALKASGLQKYGYDRVNIDGGWHDKGGSATFDRNGRPIASPNAFSDLPGTVKYIHKNGQKAGLYTVPGVSTGAYDANYPILGTPYTVRDIIVDPTIGGNTGIGFGWWSYKIDYTKPGAQEYIDSIVKLWASWGVDYIKLDFVGPSSENAVEVDNRDDVEAWNKAIAKSGRAIWLELSVALGKDGAETWQNYANGRRIDQHVECNCKTIGEWTRVLTRFYDLVEWQGTSGPGLGWNDLDGLPVGNALMDGLTFEEQKTATTLWAMANSPMYISGDLTNLDPESKKLLTNKDVLAVQESGKPARQILGGNTQIWASPKLGDGSYYVAMFNLNAFSAPVTVPWKLLEFESATQVRDLWSGKNLGRSGGEFTAILPGHGSRLLKVTPKGTVAPPSSQSVEAEKATLSGAVSAQPCAKCSGGEKVVGIGGGTANTLTFDQITAPRDGTYVLTLDYLTVQNRAFQFSVNGGPLATVTVGGTSSNLPSATRVPVTLKVGKNTIRFSNPAAVVLPDLDRITVSGDGTLTAPFGTTYEAENATLTGSATQVARPSADIRNGSHWQWRYMSNSAGAGPIAGSGSAVTFDKVSVTTAGTYQVEVSHVAFTSRPLRVSVNGAPGRYLDLRGNDKWDTAARTVIQVDLKAGNNTIEFSNPDASQDNGAFLDAIVVAPVVGDPGAACAASTSTPYWAYGLGPCEWTYSGSWSERANSLETGNPNAPATGYILSAAPGSSATISFTNAKTVTLSGIRSPQSGIIVVQLDGKLLPAIDLYQANGATLSELLRSKHLDRSTTHTLTITVSGAKNPASSGTEVGLAEIRLD